MENFHDVTGEETVKKILLFVLTLSWFFILPNISYSYETDHTHPTLTLGAMSYYNLSFPENIQKEYVRQGSIDEDYPGLDTGCVFPRYFYHFLGENDEGWKPLLSNAKDFATSSARQVYWTELIRTNCGDIYNSASMGKYVKDFSWENAKYQYLINNYTDAYLSLGHVSHLLEDMGVPAHVRNETHFGIENPLIPYSNLMVTGDPYEWFVNNRFGNNLSNPNVIPDSISNCTSPECLFNNLSNYTRSNFFTKDTIGNMDLTWRVNHNCSTVDDNKKEYVKCSSLDIDNRVENGEYYIARRSILSLLTGGSLYSLDEKVYEDYWHKLSPRVMQSVAKLINLYHKEVGYIHPLVQTTEPSYTGTHSVTLNGTVNPNGASTEAWFEWGQDPTLATSTETAPHTPLGPLSSPQQVSFPLSGLDPHITYYYRVVASNGSGAPQKGSIQSFGPPLATPIVFTGSATSITSTGATLNGSANPNGLQAEVWFEYGTDPALASPLSTPHQDIGNGITDQSVVIPISGLTAGTTYYYRIAASNIDGTQRGDVGTFISKELQPSISIGGEETWNATMYGSKSYTVPEGNNRILVVAFSQSNGWFSGAMGGNASFNSAQFFLNGMPMNEGATTSHGWGAKFGAGIYYIVNPPVGGVTISWNVSTYFWSGMTGGFIAMTLFNCDTSNPLAGFSSSRNIITTANNSMLIDAAEVAVVPPPSSSIIPGPNQTKRGGTPFAGDLKWYPQYGYLVSSSKVASELGSHNMTWSGIVDYWSCVVAFKPAVISSN